MQIDMARFVSIDRDTPMLLPPDLRDWVPPGHLVHFLIDAIESIDTASAQINHRGTGHEQYPPAMLLALLVYSYCTGTFSSPQIEASTHSDVAVRFLCANTPPPTPTPFAPFGGKIPPYSSTLLPRFWNSPPAANSSKSAKSP
jgi:transposase